MLITTAKRKINAVIRYMPICRLTQKQHLWPNELALCYLQPQHSQHIQQQKSFSFSSDILLSSFGFSFLFFPVNGASSSGLSNLF